MDQENSEGAHDLANRDTTAARYLFAIDLNRVFC
jgi:hypothetical protein